VAVPAPEAVSADSGVEPDMLHALPRPPDQPRSLYQAPLAPPPRMRPPDGDRPYFEIDPVLDPPQWGRPGWFSSVQIDLVKPHANNTMNQRMTVGGNSTTVALGSSKLDWTVAPRFELGYRLPSGFGEFLIAERFFNTQGNDAIDISSIGPALRSSRLSVNYTDFDYGSREFTPTESWELRWRFGARVMETFQATRVDDAFGQASATNGIFAARQTNTTVGAGPHIRAEVARRLGESGFSMVGWLDLGYTFGRLTQDFSALGTTLNSAGHPTFGEAEGRIRQQVPVLNVQAGLRWRPPDHPQIDGFFGFVSESFWYVDNNSNLISSINTRTATRVENHGNFQDAGVVFRLGINY
jgi:hypothetical protein